MATIKKPAARKPTAQKARRNGSVAQENGKPKMKGKKNVENQKMLTLKDDNSTLRSDAANLRQKLRDQTQLNRSLQDENQRLRQEDVTLATELDTLHRLSQEDHAETEKLLRELDGRAPSGS